MVPFNKKRPRHVQAQLLHAVVSASRVCVVPPSSPARDDRRGVQRAAGFLNVGMESSAEELRARFNVSRTYVPSRRFSTPTRTCSSPNVSGNFARHSAS